MKRIQPDSSNNQKQACYQLLLSGTDVCLHEVDIDGCLISMYSSELKSSNVSFDDISGSNYPGLFDEEDRVYLQGLIDQAKQGNAFEYEFSFELEESTWYFALSFMPVTDKQGEVVKLAGFTQNFTAQVKATFEREQTAGRFQNLVDTVEGIVCEADATSFQFLYINQYAVRLLGYPPHVLMAPDFWIDKMHPDDRSWVPDYCHKCREEGPGSYQLEYRMIAADGRVVWLRDLKTTGFDNKYKRILRGLMVDITDQKELEVARNVAEKRFRSMFMESPIGLSLIDVETGAVVEINSAYQQIMGRDIDELNRIGWQALTYPDDLEIELPYLARLENREMSSYQMEKRFFRPDNSLLWGDLSVTILEGDTLSNRPQYLITLQDITERVEFESELRKHSLAVKYSPSAILITDTQQIIEYVNPRFTEITGYTKEAVIGKSSSILKPGKASDEQNRKIREIIASGEEWKGELDTRKQEGSYYRARYSISGARNVDGELTHYISIHDDVTQERQVEERFRGMVNAIDGIVWERTERNDRLNYVSQQVVSLLGYSTEQLTNLWFWLEIIHPEDRKRVMDYSKECVNSKLNMFQQEYRMIASDGRALWFRDRVTVAWEVGKRPLLRGITVDITERRKAESRFRTIFMSATLGLALTDSETDVLLEINPAYERIVGRDTEEIKRLGWQAITHPDDLKKDERNLQLIREGKIPDYTMIKRFIKPGGDLAWTEVTVAPVNGGSISTAPQYLVMLNDISESRETMMQLKESEAHYKYLVNTIGGVIWEADPFSAEHKYVGEQAERFFGYPAKDWLSPGFWVEKIHPRDQSRVVEYCASCFGQGLGRYELDYRFVRRDGHHIPVRDIVSVTRGEDGSYLLSGIIIDSTESMQKKSPDPATLSWSD